MRAMQIIEWGKPLETREYPDPEPKGEEVLLRVEAAGVCHSDVHIWDGYFDLGGERRISLESRGVHLPFTMGHEIAGEVAALGPHASGVKVGDKVVAYPWIGCGEGTVMPQPAHPRHPTGRRLWHTRNRAEWPLPPSA
jgi:propanol-preferring alcohol dehydrogenase